MTEKQLHKSICDYIRLQYPNVLFNTDMSGIKLTIGQATQAKKLRSDKGFPDIVIYAFHISDKTNYVCKVYSALFLEVKKETPFKKDGKLKKSDHLSEQLDMQNKLNALGYKAEFVWSFDMAKDIIDNYLK